MFRGIDSIIIFSENAKRLADFYKTKVGLEVKTEAEVGEGGEELYELRAGKTDVFYIMDHSKVKGKNRQPERMMVNFEVDDIEKEVKRLDSAGVKKVADTYHLEGYGYIATFEDVDGNYFQFVQVRA